MFFWVHIARQFLIRSLRSTAILILMVVAAVAVLIFLSSLAVGINDTMIRNSARLFPGHISGFKLPLSLPPTALLTPQVSSVLKRIRGSGIVSHQDHNGMVTLMLVDPDQEQKEVALWKKILQGRFPVKGKKEVFISRYTAESLRVKTGDAFQFRKAPDAKPIRLKVSGIYRTGVDRIDRVFAFAPLGLDGISAETWEAAIFIKAGVDPQSVLRQYSRLPVGTGTFKTWKQLMPDLKQLIELNYISMSMVMVLVFGVVAIGIACAFTIFILKNMREYGILKTMGISPVETLLLIGSKVILLNLVSACMGIFIGVAVVSFFARSGIDLGVFTSHNQYFIVSGVIYPRLTVYSLCLPPALAFVFGILAAVWPAALVLRGKVVDLVRSI